jgi:DNA polymerase-1
MLLIIDGNNLAHRCKHTFSLSNHGVDVSVTYGFLRVLGTMLQKFSPSSVIVCWDGGVPEYRKRAVPEYKANRHIGDDPDEYVDFMRQMKELENIALPLMGVVSVWKYGAEADDLMYHASRIVKDKSIIVTTDKDLLQAVTSNVSVYNPVRDVIYTPDLIEETFGVPVDKFVDWRALQGDSSDNIPGVYGVGEKTATKLFQEYGNLTCIMNVALGLHSKLVMKGKIAANIAEFGFQRLEGNLLITNLRADRVGARNAIIEAVGNRAPVNTTGLKKYLHSNGFISLVDGKLFSNLLKLKTPMMRTNLLMPVIISKQRIPYED